MSAVRGNTPDTTNIAKVKKGEHNQNDVIALIGPPTSRAPFNTNIWYYIGEKTEKTAFFDPDVVDKQIIKITFDEKGVVNDLQLANFENSAQLGQEIDPNERKTTSSGHDISVMEQLLGNFGRQARSSTQNPR